MFSNKKVVLMGLGLYEKGSGMSAARFFVGRCRELVITDLKTAGELKKQIEEISKEQGTRNMAYPEPSRREQGTNVIWHLGGHRKEDFKNADMIFQNPSVPSFSPFLKIARRRGIPIVNDWSMFLSVHQPDLFIGVTGTKGKSTIAALVCKMLKKKNKKMILAGNIGRSPLDFIDSYRGEPIVAELSSWLLHHFSSIKKSPNIAVVTNIMKDHMDKYRSAKEYVADKKNIFRFQKTGDKLVLNWDNKNTKEMGRRLLCHSERSPAKRGGVEESLAGASTALKNQQRVIWFSLERHLPGWVPLGKIRLLGKHNMANALAAAAAAEAAGVSRREIVSVLRNFRGLPNRLELVGAVDGVKYYNDSAATAPEAAIAALNTLGKRESRLCHFERSPAKRGGVEESFKTSGSGNIILIAGGADKKLDYKKFAQAVKKYCKAVILFKGGASGKIYQAIKQCGEMTMRRNIKDMRRAVQQARQFARRGDIILLSPAAASFGLFKNEFDRGEQFTKHIRKFAKNLQIRSDYDRCF